MLIRSSLLIWTIVQLFVPGECDHTLCGREGTGTGDCQNTEVQKHCPNICTDHGLCQNINAAACTEASVKEECPQKCYKPAKGGGCPDGFFNVPESLSQCFKVYAGNRSWDSADSFCKEEGKRLGKTLLLAKVDDPPTAVAVTKFIVETHDAYVWIGGRGTGTSDGTGHIEWVRDKTEVYNTNSAWRSDQPGQLTSTKWCLNLLSRKGRNTEQPYDLDSCSDMWYPLCEVI